MGDVYTYPFAYLTLIYSLARPFKITPLTVPVYWLDAIDPPVYTPPGNRLSVGWSHVREAGFSQHRDWDDGEESLARWETYVVPYPNLLHGEMPRLPVFTTDYQQVELLNPDEAAATPMGRLWLRLLSLSHPGLFYAPNSASLPSSTGGGLFSLHP